MKSNRPRLAPSLALAAALAARPAGAAEEKVVFTLTASVYRITASVSGNTSLTEDIGVRDEAGRPAVVQGPFTYFTLADLKVGGMELKMDEKGVRWNGAKDPPARGEAVRLHGPVLTTLPGQSGEIFVGGGQEIQYMERLPDGRFELRTQVLDTGLTLLESIVEAGPGRVKIDPLEVSISSVQEREPIPGVELAVGKPILTQDRARLSLTVPLDRPLGIQWRAKQGMLLLVLQVTRGEGR